MKIRLIAVVIAAAVMALGSLTGCSEAPSATGPVVEVGETISVIDSPQMSTPPFIRVEDTISITDFLQMLTSPVITVMEPITITDSVRILQPVVIRILDTITVTDTTTIQTRQVQSLPTINFFIADPDHIYRGGSSTLAWNVTGATTITIDHNIGNVSSIGTIVVKPGLTTTYNMKATNSAGSVKAAVTVTVTIKIF